MVLATDEIVNDTSCTMISGKPPTAHHSVNLTLGLGERLHQLLKE